MNRYMFVVLALVFAACATSQEEQRQAQQHQYNSDEAAKNGKFGIAGKEQRLAEDSHHSAVVKAIKEGEPIPRQTQQGDPNPDGGR